MNQLDSVFGNIQGAGLVGGNNRVGVRFTHECTKGASKSGLGADPKQTQFFESGLEADPQLTPSPLSRYALVLGWVRSVLYIPYS